MQALSLIDGAGHLFTVTDVVIFLGFSHTAVSGVYRKLQ